MIDINPVELARIQAIFAGLLPRVQKQVLGELAQVAFNTAQAQVDTHTKTNALKRSLQLLPEGETGWKVYNDTRHAPYAWFVHWGSRPHIIKPKDRKALRWVAGAGGGTHFRFAKQVNHPGYRGDAWFIKAADEAVKQFDSIVRRVNI